MDSKKFRFREFQVYKDARLFAQKLKKFSKEKFPKSEIFALRSQMWRALDSIILNIAEGSNRGTDKDFANFLNMARTSLDEVVACLDIALDNEYINLKEHAYHLKLAGSLLDQLTAFRNSLINNPTK